MSTESPEPRADPLGDALPVRAGARWTREEDEELVAGVRAGDDLPAIAARLGRSLVGAESRLVRMVPDGENVRDWERLAWIMARLRDPGFDWRARLDSSAAARKPGRREARHECATGADAVLGIWQQVTGRVLREERRSAFLAHPAIDDLTAFTEDALSECGRRLHGERGELLLGTWAAECAAPGIAGMPYGRELGESIMAAAEVVRRLVAALVMAVRHDGNREVLQRRLGLHGGAPQTQRQIADDLGLPQERIWQRRMRASIAVRFGCCPQCGPQWPGRD